MTAVFALRAALIAVALASAPAITQPAAAPPNAMPGMAGMGQAFNGGGPLRDLSPAGRTTIRRALRTANADNTRQQIEATRAHVLDLLAAEPLDVSALSRAMQEERNLALGKQSRTQAAMLGAFQKLSLADRRAFVSTAREVQARVEERRAAQKARVGRGMLQGPDGR